MSSVIEIKPLTRVEGHGSVRVYLAGNSIERVELSLIEPPRLFEALLLNKHYQEIPDIVCRICSLCSTIHRVTALQAIENAMGIQITNEGRLYRELIVYGGHIQSHALHLFCLVLPDHFDVSGFSGLAKYQPDLLRLGLGIKGVGNMIQEMVGGRLIHPVNIKVGGIGQSLRENDLRKIHDAIHGIIPDIHRAIDLFASFKLIPSPLAVPTYMAVASDTAEPFFGSTLSTSDGNSFSATDYATNVAETTMDHTHSKISRVGNTAVTVGALARLNLGLPLTPLAGEAFRQEQAKLKGAAIWGNNLAQALELLFAAEKALQVLNGLLGDNEASSPPKGPVQKGTGTAVTEAPRGVLIHSYVFDGRGYCTAADIITPTAINHAVLENDLFLLAKSLAGVAENEMVFELEKLVRVYDPCISCAVHLIRL